MLPKPANSSEMSAEALDLSDEDFANFAAIVEIERIPDHSSLRITAHKGAVTIHSSHGYAGTLEEGNTFSRPMSVGGDPTEMAEYWVRIDGNQPDESLAD